MWGRTGIVRLRVGPAYVGDPSWSRGGGTGAISGAFWSEPPPDVCGNLAGVTLTPVARTAERMGQEIGGFAERGQPLKKRLKRTAYKSQPPTKTPTTMLRTFSASRMTKSDPSRCSKVSYRLG